MSNLESAKNIRDGYIWTRQTCPICGNGPDKLVGKRGGGSHREGLGVECEIWRCSTCDLRFPDPMPFPEGGLGQHYNIDADDYFKEHDVDDRMSGARDMVGNAERILGTKGRLLDVGIGRGELLTAAAEAGWYCEGIEPSATFAEYVSKKTGTKIWQQSIEDTNLDPSSFDVVILAAVLEHLYDPDVVLSKISDVLRPGGLLYIDVPNEAGLYFKIGNAYQTLLGRDWCVNLAPTFSPFHVFGFSPKSLRKILHKHGLKPKEWRVYGGTSVLPNRGGMVGSLEHFVSKAVTTLSNVGEMGTYIETWAVKS